MKFIEVYDALLHGRDIKRECWVKGLREVPGSYLYMADIEANDWKVIYPPEPPPMRCPFCGNFRYNTVIAVNTVNYQNECYECGARGPWGKTEIDAKEAWVKRWEEKK